MTRQSAQKRAALDPGLDRLHMVAEDLTADRGWIRAIREALGMSSIELAARMEVGQSSISELERSETRGTIKLRSLGRAADALDCDLVYFFVPRTTLDDAVRVQARHKAAQERGDTGSDKSSRQIEERAEELLDRRGLWSEPSGTG